MIKLRRRANWQSRLELFLFAFDSKPYRFGRHDCFHRTLGAVREMTGVDFSTHYLGAYSSPRSALRRMMESGFDTLPQVLSSQFPKITPLMARAGDIGILVDADVGEHLAICKGRFFETITAHGVLRSDASRVHSAYKVG